MEGIEPLEREDGQGVITLGEDHRNLKQMYKEKVSWVEETGIRKQTEMPKAASWAGFKNERGKGY